MRPRRSLFLLLSAVMPLLSACNRGAGVTPLPELSLSGISPERASTEGGTMVTLTGKNFFQVLSGTGFQSELAVTVCGVPLSDLEVQGETRDIIAPPAQSLRIRMGDTMTGTLAKSDVEPEGDVVVTRPDGQQLTLDGAFECYDPTPVVADFTLESRPVVVGQPVTFAWTVGSPAGQALACTLDPGDGSEAYRIADCATTTSRQHTYTEAGNFTATLAVEDGAGHRQRETLELTVFGTDTATMQKSAGDAQRTTVGTSVATPPSVVVLGTDGRPVAGLTVTFAVTGGGGSVTGATQVTDADGAATVGAWTLGTVAGENRLRASVAGVGALTFTATATPAAAHAISMVSGNGGQQTVGTTRTLKAKVTDAYGNPIEGYTVEWDITVPVGVDGPAGGSLDEAGDSTTSTTNAEGVASVVWTIGTDAFYDQEGTASAAGLTGSPLTYEVDAVAGAPAKLVVNTQPTPEDLDGEVVAGEAFGISLLLQDAYGNAAPYGDPAPIVTLSLGDHPAGATLQGETTTALTDFGGSYAGFSDLTIETAASGYTLEASVTVDGKTITAETGPFEVHAGTATRMEAVDTTGTIYEGFVGQALHLRVRVEDEFGNGVPGEELTIESVTGGGGVANSVASGPDEVIVTDASGVAELVWLLGPSGMPTDGSGNAQELDITEFADEITFTARAYRRPLAAGDRHAVAIHEDGTLYSWGDPFSQAVGDDITEPIAETPSTGNFVAVAADGNLSAALKTDGTIEVWGEHAPDVSLNNSGIVAVDVSHLNVEVMAHSFVIALKNDGSLVVWGDDTFGQVSDTPTGSDFVAVAAGELHAVALQADGSLVMWGDGQADQPLGVTEGAFVEISARHKNTLALTADGEIRAWTVSHLGEQPSGDEFVAISAGYYLAAAFTASGEVVAWGASEFNPEGTNISNANAATETFVAVAAASAGSIIALKADGTVVEWDVGNDLGAGNEPTGTFDAPPPEVARRVP